MANVVQVILRGVDQFSGTFQRATKDFNAFRAVAANTLVAVTGALVTASASAVAFTQHAINLADETGKAAQKAGVATEQFSELAYAAKLAELEMDDLVRASKNWSQAAAAGKSITGSFVGDLEKLADQFAASTDGAAKVALAVEKFGKSGQALIPLLNQGSAALREQFEEAQKFGLVIGRDFARNADTFNDNLERMRALFQGVWNQVAERVLPTFIAYSEALLKIARDSTLIENAVNTLTTVVLSTARGILLATEAWITFTGLLSGQSFAEVGAQLNTLEANIEEIRSSLENPFPEPRMAGPTPEEKAAHVQKLMDQFARTWLETNNEFFRQSGRIHDEFLAAVQKINADEMLSEQQKNFFIQNERELLKKKMLKIEEDEARERRRIQQGILSATSGLFGNLATLAASHGKKGFALAQGFRYAEAVVSTAAGVARALAEFPWPYSIIVGALVAAAGAVQLATIASAKPPQAHAGLGYVPQESTYLLSRGERVLAPEQNTDLTRFLEQQGPSGGLGPTQIVLELDGKSLGAVLWDLSRNGRLRLDPRSVLMIRAVLQNAGPVGTYLSRLPGEVLFATVQSLNATARDVQSFALKTALPSAFTLRARGQPWQKPGSRFGFNIRPFATRQDLTATIGSQADWLRLQEKGGTKSAGAHRLAIEAGARPSRTAVLPAALKPRRVLARRKRGAFVVELGSGTSLIVQRTGPKTTRLLYVLKPKANVKARLGFEERGAALADRVFPYHFTRFFARGIAITTNAALVRDLMRLFSPNLIDAAGVAISPVTEDQAWPAINLANAQRTLLYRTLATVTAEAVVFDLGSAQSATGIILLDHTILNTATIAIQANSSNSWGAPPFSSAITWRADWILHTFASQTYRYWRLVVTKASAGTTFDIGRLWLGAHVAPTDPPDSDGFNRGLLDLSTAQRSESGQLYCTPRPQARRLELDFSWIRDAQKEQFLSIIEAVGTHTPLFVQVDENAGADEMAEPVYARLTETPKFHHAGWDGAAYWDTSLRFEEAL